MPYFLIVNYANKLICHVEKFAILKEAKILAIHSKYWYCHIM